MLREILEARQEFSKPALSLIKKLIDVRNKKINRNDDYFHFNIYENTISRNNGPTLTIEDKKPILTVNWYNRCTRGDKSRDVITSEIYNEEFTCLRDSVGNTIKEAMQLELKIYKKMPQKFDWEDYENGGIIEKRGWLSGSGYINHSVVGIDPKTKLEVLKSYIFFNISNTFEVGIEDNLAGEFEWEDRMDSIKLIASALKKGKEVLLNTASS